MIRKMRNFYVKKMQKLIIMLCDVLVIAFCITGCTKKNDEKIMLLPIENTGESMIEKAEDSDEQPINVADESVTPALVCVHVCGAVNSPNVYELPEGSRIYEAIELAGGFTEDACKDYVNLAMAVTDESKIVVPTIQEAEEDSVWLRQENSVQDVNNGLVNINTADVTGLCTLPGIGEAKAEAIIDYRNKIGRFDTIEQIKEVEGIKEGMYSRIQDKICVK